MNLFKNISLQKKFHILFSLSITIALCCSLILCTISFRALRNDKRNYAQSIVTNLTHHTEELANSLKLMAETISYTAYTSPFLTVTKAKKTPYEQQLKRIFNKLVDSSPYIHSILLKDTAGIIYSFSSFDYSLAASLDQQHQIFSIDAYSESYSNKLNLSTTNTTYATYMQPIFSDKYTTEKKIIGTCIIIFSFEALDQIYQNIPFSSESLFALLDSSNQILISNQDNETTYQQFSNNKTHFIMQLNCPSVTNWSIICSIPYSELYSEIATLYYLSTILIIIMFLTFFLLSRYFSQEIISPLNNIANFLRHDSFYVLHNKLVAEGCQETKALCTHINQTLNQINELNHTVVHNQAQLYEKELATKQAQLSTLQTQINPHFIFNTLNAIKGLTYQNDLKGIAISVDSLAHIMRYCLNQNNMTCIKDEFISIKNYLKIIEIRFPKRFLFHLNMNDEIGAYEMPRFLLQPLVENAISHGLEPKTEKGTLTLSADLRDNNILHFECTDDGVGIPLDELEALKQNINNLSSVSNLQTKNHFKIGLANINKRIQLIYGTPYGLSIYSSPKGTTVCVDFPANVPANIPASRN